jgi:hypothetical protein
MNFLVKPMVPVLSLFGAAAAADCTLDCTLKCDLSGPCDLTCKLGPIPQQS